MTDHLTNDEITRLLMGEAEESRCAHLRACRACRSELERFELALSGMRGSIRHWSDREFAVRAAAPGRHSQSRRVAYAGFAAVCAVTLLLIAPWWRQPVPDAAVVATAPGLSDDVLLRQVSVELTRFAPSGMEPLAPATLP